MNFSCALMFTCKEHKAHTTFLFTTFFFILTVCI